MFTNYPPQWYPGLKRVEVYLRFPCIPSWLEQGQIYPFYLCLTGGKTRNDSGPSSVRDSSNLIRLDVFYNCNFFIYVIVQKLASASHGKFIKTFISTTTYGSQQIIQSVCYHGDGHAHGTAEHSCTVFRRSTVAGRLGCRQIQYVSGLSVLSRSDSQEWNQALVCYLLNCPFCLNLKYSSLPF